MLRWHMTFERKLVEQSVLPALTFPHHRQHSNPPDRIESPPPCPGNSRFFSTQSALSRSSGRDRALPVCDRNGHSSRLGSDLRRGGFASQSPKVIKSIRPA